MKDIYIKTESGEIRKLNKKKLLIFVLILMGTIAAIAGIVVLTVSIVKKQPENNNDMMMGDIFSKGYYSRNHTEVLTSDMSQTAIERIEESEPLKEDSILAVYEEMKRNNPDFAGYLAIDGTEIEYPVMYTPDEPEKYLHKDINGAECDGGLPFIDARCSIAPDSDNIIIFGHNMRDGSRFGTLTMYDDKDYYKEHPVIHFDTPEGRREYEVMSAFYDRVYYTDEDDFRFYNFIDSDNKEDYNKAIDSYIDKSIYDTGVRAQYGDKLITLVTCAYQEDNGRFVVVARNTP